ncbi:MAG: DUF6011 domain-containing protein [Chloroflexi bacterium]|nr:DUF6011 domain-containing protein [Chloroflexota bacterium]
MAQRTTPRSKSETVNEGTALWRNTPRPGDTSEVATVISPCKEPDTPSLRPSPPVRDVAYFTAAYRAHPKAAARRLDWVRRQAQAARQRGDQHEAGQYEDVAAQLEAALGQLVCCRRCGRHLTHPDSVAAGIGPECARETRPDRRVIDGQVIDPQPGTEAVNPCPK